MSFYNLTKEERIKLVEKISQSLLSDFENKTLNSIFFYFSDEDTYIRKSAYIAVGKIYKSNATIQQQIIQALFKLVESDNEKIRQTVINAAGEIGIIDFNVVEKFMEVGLFDEHHSVRNAVIGSIKKMGEKNPKPTLKFAKRYLNHHDKEIRREICHGIELRGRTHPEDILPLLKELQFDKTSRVRNTLVHVLGQIAYKKGCLEIVIAHIKKWENKELIKDAILEIIDVHNRHKNFAAKTQEEAVNYIDNNL